MEWCSCRRGCRGSCRRRRCWGSWGWRWCWIGGCRCGCRRGWAWRRARAADVGADGHRVNAPACASSAAISSQAEAKTHGPRWERHASEGLDVAPGVARPRCAACDWTEGSRRDRSVVKATTARRDEVHKRPAVYRNLQDSAVQALFQIVAMTKNQEGIVVSTNKRRRVQDGIDHAARSVMEHAVWRCVGGRGAGHPVGTQRAGASRCAVGWARSKATHPVRRQSRWGYSIKVFAEKGDQAARRRRGSRGRWRRWGRPGACVRGRPLDVNRERRSRLEEANRCVRRLRRTVGIETEIIQRSPTKGVRILVLRKGLRTPAQVAGGLIRGPGGVAVSRVSHGSIVGESRMIQRSMKPDIADRDSASQRQTEGLDPAIEILVIDRVFIMPNTRNWAVTL